MILDMNFLYNYSIMWDSIILNLFCSCFFLITDIIFKIPIGPAQRQHRIFEKTHCKTSCLSIIVPTLDR